MLWLLIAVLATIPRLHAVLQMPAFGDEIYWLEDGLEALQRWQSRGSAEDIWGPRVLRHPGTPTALAGGLAAATRDANLDRVAENERILLTARLSVVWLGVLGCVVVAMLGARLYGIRAGALAGIILALSPHHIANSAWLQCDASLATFSIASVLALAVHLRNGKLRWLLASAGLAGLAINCKWTGLLTIPLTFGAMVFLRLRASESWPRAVVDGVRPSLYWLGVAVSVLYLTWPRMWFDPSELFKTILWAKDVGASHLTFFQGEITESPAWYYYFVAVPFSLSELESLLLAGAVAGAVIAAFRGRLRMNQTSCLLLVWIFLFLLAMTLSGKKLGARYVLPIWPALALLLAASVRAAYRRLRHLAHMRACTATAALAAGLAACATLAATGGNYPIHANRLLGGLPAMDRSILIVGVADREVARFLDTLPASATVQIAGNLLSTRWHAHHAMKTVGCDLAQGLRSARKVAPISADFVGVFSHFSHRCPEWNHAAMLAAHATEVHRLERDGVVLARVYRAERADGSAPPGALPGT
ncbi:MAG: glycosyltransferase family 39 protein [Xanthomonadales bacterium]|nr:glycosyltransferase family 39 protein [Xanthomonadales bacterium]